MQIAFVFRFVWAFALFGDLQPALASQQFCIPKDFAQLSDSSSCRARFDTICLSQSAWLRWLQGDYSECQNWQGKWKVSAASGQKRFVALDFDTGPRRSESGPFWRSFATQLRVRVERLRVRSSEFFSDHDPLGICRHLLLNEKAASRNFDLLRLTGFVHVLTATGIHLYYLASWWERIFRIFAEWGGLPLRVAFFGARATTFLTWSFAWILSGARAGMLRPWLVVCARKAAEILGFRWRSWAPLAIALLVDLFVAVIRGNLSNSGRWIYALAVGGGLWISGLPGNAFAKHARLAVASWVFVALYEVASGGLVAVATPILSLVTLPLFCFALYPGLLLSTGLLMWGDAGTARILLEGLSSCATQVVKALFLATQAVPSLWIIPREWLLISAIMGGSLSIFRIGPRTLILVSVLLISSRVAIEVATPIGSQRTADQKVRAQKLEQLDVGQGDAALVFADDRTSPVQSTGLVDSGSERAHSDADWIRLFAERGVNRLNWIFLTHLDEDHSGGARKLNSLMPIDCVEIPIRDAESHCTPFPTLVVGAKSRAKNEAMGAIWIPLVQGGYYLSAGDASTRAEIPIARWAHSLAIELSPAGPEPWPRILKVGHHGSRTSTSDFLLKTIRPTQAWISVGATNSYGHPSAVVLSRLSKWGISTLRTDRLGTISFDAARMPFYR